jgi:surface antigen
MHPTTRTRTRATRAALAAGTASVAALGLAGPAAASHPVPEGGGSSLPASIRLHNDYPFRNASPNEIDPWAFYKRECTSFVAYRLNKVMRFSNHMRGGHFGNAMNWDDNARAIGFRVNRRPRVGSVMVRNSGTFGHVATVARVRPHRVFVEQYNAGGTHTYSKQWLPKSSVMTFIHFKRRR